MQPVDSCVSCCRVKFVIYFHGSVGLMKIHRGADEAGLVAELVNNSPDDFQADPLRLFNDSLHWKIFIIVEHAFPDDGKDGARPTTI